MISWGRMQEEGRELCWGENTCHKPLKQLAREKSSNIQAENTRTLNYNPGGQNVWNDHTPGICPGKGWGRGNVEKQHNSLNNPRLLCGPNSHLSRRIRMMKRFVLMGDSSRICLLVVSGGEGWVLQCIWHSAPHSAPHCRCSLSLFRNSFWRDTWALIAGKARGDQKPVYLRLKSERCTWNSITWDHKLPAAFTSQHTCNFKVHFNSGLQLVC